MDVQNELIFFHFTPTSYYQIQEIQILGNIDPNIFAQKSKISENFQ
jgi:hypothetical protein